MSRVLLSVAFLLALIVVGTSSGLRLMNNGLGCEPWPSCYGAAATAEAAQQSPSTKGLRLTHRVSASAFALAAVAGVVLGWRRWNRRTRAAAVLVLATTAVLSWVGLYTPSPVPMVTLVNVLGGLTLLGGIAFVLTSPPSPARHRRGRGLALAATLLLVAFQAAAGAMISVRSAGAACEPGCAAQWPPGAIELWNPLQAGNAEELVRSTRAGEPLHALHRLGAIAVTILATIVVGAGLTRSVAPASRRAIFTLTTCVALGLLLSSSGGTWLLAIAHALSAGILVASLAILLAGVLSGRGP